MNIFRYSLTIIVVVFAAETHCDNGISKSTILVNSVIACEDKSVALICPDDAAISILAADYGRSAPGSRVCPNPNIRTTSCTSGNSVTQIVSQQCDGRRRCELDSSNSVFGDPCAGTHKYLSVSFLCV